MLSLVLFAVRVNVYFTTTRADELLGLERSSLYRKMKTLGIAPKE